MFVGHDWAEANDVHVEDEQGRRPTEGPAARGGRGVACFHELVAPFAEDPAEVVIATETDRPVRRGAGGGRLSGAGSEPDVDVALARTHSTSAARSDPGDARVLAELARTDAHNHRPIGELAEAMKVVARGPPVDDLDAPAPDQPAPLNPAEVSRGR